MSISTLAFIFMAVALVVGVYSFINGRKDRAAARR